MSETAERKTRALRNTSGVQGEDGSICRLYTAVQYETGVVKEHMAVRTACGLFDVSHMGEILCKGPDALKNLNWLLTMTTP